MDVADTRGPCRLHLYPNPATAPQRVHSDTPMIAGRLLDLSGRLLQERATTQDAVLIHRYGAR